MSSQLQEMQKIQEISQNPQNHRQMVHAFRAKFNNKRKWYDKFADFLTEIFGTVAFFAINLTVFVGWIVWNIIPGLPQFDTYPFNFLTMMVSLEAIFLSIIVLISQNRQSLIADMREEIDFNVNIKAEEEITKILNMLDQINEKLGIESMEDLELNEMKKKTDLEMIEVEIAREYLNSQE